MFFRIQNEITLLSDKTMEINAKNKNLRQELMILIKTNKILKSRMLNGLGTIDEASVGSSMVDDESTNSFISYKQSNNDKISYNYNVNEINELITPNTFTNSNLEIVESPDTPLDVITQTSRATDHNMTMPAESTYSSTSNLGQVGKFSSTESDLIILENPKVVELNHLLQSR